MCAQREKMLHAERQKRRVLLFALMEDVHFVMPNAFSTSGLFLQMKKPVDRGNKKLFVACEAVKN
ncbi:hypothetical protein T05_6307 [Trichinella murrelli]|uniref:Uncharacterized protein n=1 Tax=Trichinella murrelli TaxID=144512 RepID=A0A0V0TQ53_9BILA|nr:hypothetical protein T05_6307 [Trichinella murrelli]